ncbi:YggS family pyridoxal phosphate-dependent enzyme [Bacillus sp. FJAT-44742]|uniref:YggS family pyridoxal phosphate-dependent enzyme n=1 Tax=Bacillus sp. FJAT-44742 TaxID=2014005 RepID=UPI000C23534A|nr:YggS family pyridoxal phosphate-dependent enzyme [Bacillus sp. FJAT-44742]
MDIKQNLTHIESEIKLACQRGSRSEDDIAIIAVTKYVSVETASKALEAGIRHIGENRAEEGTAKIEKLDKPATWHFIGSLQSKKVKHMIDKFDYIHSLDRISLAKEIQKRMPEGRKMKCFVQVNVSGEESKSGLSPEDTLSFIKSLEEFPAIEVVGLMTMAPYTENPEETRPVFRNLRLLRDSIKDLNLSHAPCLHLSMGMSNDYVIAVEEGATFVRIGSSLVGKE